MSVVIVSAARTAIGRFMGALASKPAHLLGAEAIKAVVARAALDPTEIDEVILGQVLTAAQGQNPARQAMFAAGLHQHTSAFLVNQVCGSGLRAVALGAQQIMSGDARIVIAGGQESMSRAPHAIWMRAAHRMGDIPLIDTLQQDGLCDAYHHYPMGQTAENIAKKWHITRAQQDEFALNSQQKAHAAQVNGAFNEEITPVQIGDHTILQDEHIRPNLTLESLSQLKPVFDPLGSVTAGNSSGMNDGAAALVLISEQEAAKRGLEPLARIVSMASVGVDPALMGIGPVPAARKALSKAGWRAQDLELIELNEAFAAQSLAVIREMEWDPLRVNVNGGAIALGHPIGASGARVLVTLLHAMQARKLRKGLVTLCIGGGMGIAICIER